MSFFKYIVTISEQKIKWKKLTFHFHKVLNSYSISRLKRISIKIPIIGDTFREGKKEQCFIQNYQGKLKKG